MRAFSTANGALAALIAFAAVAAAQQPVVQTTAIERTATIQAIDKGTRLITLRDPSGMTETIYAGPEVKRFDELKVGDTISAKYYESMAYQIRKPGQAAAPNADGEPAVTRGTGAKPSATIAKQDKATVTIKAIDPAVPMITAATDDGRTFNYRVADKKNLKGLAVGDRVEITYTMALLLSVK